MSSPGDIEHVELKRLQAILSDILASLIKLEGRWVHSESDARFVIDSLRDMNRHVRDISLNLKGL